MRSGDGGVAVVLLPIFMDFPVGSFLNASHRAYLKTAAMLGTMVVNVVLNALRAVDGAGRRGLGRRLQLLVPLRLRNDTDGTGRWRTCVQASILARGRAFGRHRLVRHPRARIHHAASGGDHFAGAVAIVCAFATRLLTVADEAAARLAQGLHRGRGRKRTACRSLRPSFTPSTIRRSAAESPRYLGSLVAVCPEAGLHVVVPETTMMMGPGPWSRVDCCGADGPSGFRPFFRIRAERYRCSWSHVFPLGTAAWIASFFVGALCRLVPRPRPAARDLA